MFSSFIACVCVLAMLCITLPASADLVISNGADINMNGSTNSTIIFPDGTVLTTADTRRAFYLTDSSATGMTALSECDPDGFHMASLWEILDPTDLRYVSDEELSDGHFAVRSDDSGFGPPWGPFGWIRTAWESSATSRAGQGNCSIWSQTSGFGSITGLNPCWGDDLDCGVTASTGNQAARWWYTFSESCAVPAPVWCVQD